MSKKATLCYNVSKLLYSKGIAMSKNIVYFISAIIFLAYGLLEHKAIFIILGIIFGVIGVADYLNHKGK